MSAVLPAPVAGNKVTWARVDSGFHVASRSGEFVGSAERTADGHYIGFDGRSTPIGRYASLAEAKDAIRESVHEETLSPRAQSVFQAAAAVSGVVALTTLAAAVVALPGIAA